MLVRVLLWVILASPAIAADWPQWLGPKRDGVWSETGILESLPESGPKVLWRKPINGGYTGPAVVNGKVFVMDRVRKDDPDARRGTTPGTERVICLDAKTGDQVWLHEYERVYEKIDRPMGPRTTPVVDGNRVYTLGSMGDLQCLGIANGQPVWSKYFPKDYSTKPPVWGYSAHLLVHENLVIALVGGDGKAVVAFDKTTGEEKWSALSTQDVGYAPPVIAGKQLIVWLSDRLAGLNPATGEVFWQHAHPEKGKKQMVPAVSIITPKIVDDVVIVSSAYDGALAVKLLDGKPAEIIWRAQDTYPKKPEKLPILMTTIIAKEQHLFGIDANTGEVVCAEASTGKDVWRSKKLFGKEALFGSAFWVEQGGRIICFTDAGDLVFLNLTKKGYEETSRAHLLDPIGLDRGRKVIWSHPAFAEKCMFVRNEKEIVCFSLAKV